jgi:hypothetical protein
MLSEAPLIGGSASGAKCSSLIDSAVLIACQLEQHHILNHESCLKSLAHSVTHAYRSEHPMFSVEVTFSAVRGRRVKGVEFCLPCEPGVDMRGCDQGRVVHRGEGL